jgi:septal ring factor EnvC (AmiA/AmiB activator)
MTRFRHAVRATALLAATLSLAAGGTQGVGVALRDYFFAAATPAAPRSPAVAATPRTATKSGAAAHRPTKGLESAIRELGRNPHKLSDRNDLRRELREEIRDIDSELDGIRDDLREARDDIQAIRPHRGSQRAGAEAKLSELEDAWRQLNKRLRDIRSKADIGITPGPLVVQARQLGLDIVLLRNEVRVLDRLISDAERRGRED